MFSLAKKRWQWAAMLLLAFIWGCSFILMKKGLDAFTDVQVASLRIFFAFLVLLPFSIKGFKKLSKENAYALALSGLIGNLIPAFLFTYAETGISSSLAGILNSLSPFFTLVAGVVIFRNRPLLLQYIGIFIGFIGAMLLVTNGSFHSVGTINFYALVVVFATLLYGINSNLIKFKLVGLSGIEITSLAFLFIGPIAGVILFSTDLRAACSSPHFEVSLLATLALSLFGSVLSLFVYNSLIHHTSAIFATSVTYIMPIFALMWGVLDGESIGLLQVLSMLIILIGVYLVNSRLINAKISRR
jgi:drug/metabolite transporter (DMT)-like permease